ncbi:MAG: fibronectin type III domain-containing protein, partial [bacterium]
ASKDALCYYYTYIDNILIASKDALWPPDNASLCDPSYDAVSLTCDLMNTPDEMEFALMVSNETTDNASISKIVTSAPFDSVRITGLEPNTEYRVAMRIKLNGEYSTWTDELTFKTFLTPSSLPYYCGFEDAEDNAKWYLFSHTGSGTTATNVYLTINNATSFAGDNSLYGSSDGVTNDYLTGSKYMFAMHTVEITEAGSYEVSAIVKNPMSGTSNNVVISLIPAEYSSFYSGNYLKNPIDGTTCSASSTT